MERAANILLLTALHTEAAVLVRSLKLQWADDELGATGELPNKTAVALHVIGPAARNLPVLGAPRLILLAGLSGGLDPALRSGAVVAQVFGDRLSLGELPVQRVRLFTATELVAAPARKAALFKNSRAAAVDMETDLVRSWAEQSDVPFLSLRAIVDAADQRLDPRLIRFVDPRGGTRTGAVAATVLRRPWMIPHLLRIGWQSKQALRNLSSAVKSVLDAAG